MINRMGMTRWIALFVLLAMIGCDTRPNTSTLRVFSWNIHNNRDDAEGVLKAIRASNADIVMLQEVPENQFPAMRQSLGYPHGYYAPDLWPPNPNVNPDGKSRGIAILSDRKSVV